MEDAVLSGRGMRSREMLLDSAAKLLAGRWPSEITLNDIAADSKLNSALVRYYFGSKNGLLLAVLLRVSSFGLQALKDLMASDLNPEEKLRHHIAGMVNVYYKHPYISKLVSYFVNGSDQKKRKIVADEFIRPMVALQKQILDEGVAQGKFRPVDHVLFYLGIVGASSSFVDSAPSAELGFGPEGISPDVRAPLIDYITSLHMRGLAP